MLVSALNVASVVFLLTAKHLRRAFARCDFARPFWYCSKKLGLLLRYLQPIAPPDTLDTLAVDQSGFA